MENDRYYVFDSDGNCVMDPAGYGSIPAAVEAASALCIYVWGDPDTAEGVTETELATVSLYDEKHPRRFLKCATVQAVLAAGGGFPWHRAGVLSVASGTMQKARVPSICFTTFGLDILSEGRDGSEDM